MFFEFQIKNPYAVANKNKCKTAARGFTLVELVAVMVLIGILSVVIVPRFIGTSGFAEYAVRDQIIVAARMAQQRAMYDQGTDACYRLQIAGARFGVQRQATPYAYVGPDADWRNGITIENDVTVDPATVYFDGLGNALDDTPDCAGSPLTDPLAINVQGGSVIQVCINPIGYIRAC